MDIKDINLCNSKPLDVFILRNGTVATGLSRLPAAADPRPWRLRTDQGWLAYNNDGLAYDIADGARLTKYDVVDIVPSFGSVASLAVAIAELRADIKCLQASLSCPPVATAPPPSAPAPSEPLPGTVRGVVDMRTARPGDIVELANGTLGHFCGTNAIRGGSYIYDVLIPGSLIQYTYTVDGLFRVGVNDERHIVRIHSSGRSKSIDELKNIRDRLTAVVSQLQDSGERGAS
jgi:hypothetical protein